MTSSTSASILAKTLDTTFTGEDVEVVRVSPLGSATNGSLTFANDPVNQERAVAAALAQGATVLVPLDTPIPTGIAGCAIPVPNPRFAFAFAVTTCLLPPVSPGIAPTARVHPSASVDPSATIGEYSVVRAGASVGAHVEVRDHVVIGADVVIGAHAMVKSHVVIGEEGFGIETDAHGNNFRIPHLGSVRIGEHVEIGAFSTVCAGTMSPTIVGDYTKTDDHVHIAHNAKVGRNVLILAGAKISGSVTVGDGAWVGPNTVTINGVELGRNSQLGLGAVALKSVPENEVRMGNPARRIGDRYPAVDADQ